MTPAQRGSLALPICWPPLELVSTVSRSSTAHSLTRDHLDCEPHSADIYVLSCLLTVPRSVVIRDVELTAAAMEAIGDYYAELRSESATGALPVTVRDCQHRVVDWCRHLRPCVVLCPQTFQASCYVQYLVGSCRETARRHARRLNSVLPEDSSDLAYQT